MRAPWLPILFALTFALTAMPLAAQGPAPAAVPATAPAATDPTAAAPAPDPTMAPLRKIGGGVLPPVLKHKADPKFTSEARKAGPFMGIVLVNLIVDTKGMPRNVHVLRGVGMGLDENAVEAVKKYRFQPATQNGKPVPVELNVEVNFQVTP